MALKQIIYASRPFGFDQGGLNSILSTARRRNSRHDITGALICRADVYLQLLEGPAEAIGDTFERIQRDDRHMEVTLIRDHQVEGRLFPQWSMLDDPARSWLWNQAEIAAGALQAASPEEVLAVFARIAGEPRDHAGRPPA